MSFSLKVDLHLSFRQLGTLAKWTNNLVTRTEITWSCASVLERPGLPFQSPNQGTPERDRSPSLWQILNFSFCSSGLGGRQKFCFTSQLSLLRESAVRTKGKATPNALFTSLGFLHLQDSWFFSTLHVDIFRNTYIQVFLFSCGEVIHTFPKVCKGIL